jgi:hypothetical protein
MHASEIAHAVTNRSVHEQRSAPRPYVDASEPDAMQSDVSESATHVTSSARGNTSTASISPVEMARLV